jgi:aspartyl-tRNA(Asn)/glutamyl-tRNA(Gln) amidotransferase subunit B
MREKVEGVDYKYYIDTNIPPYKLDSEFIQSVREEIPVLPIERKKRYINEYKFSVKDASALAKEREISDYFEECIKIGINFDIASNWVLTQIMGYLNKYEINIENLFLTPQYLKIIIDNINNKTISGKQAKEIFFKVLEENKSPDEFITKGTMQITDRDQLEKIINEILANNQKQVEDYKSGKTNIFDYFVGQVMRETKGKANPDITSELLSEKLQ